MSSLTRVCWAGYAWTIEHYHRGIKHFCDVERAHVRTARAQRNHIRLVLAGLPALGVLLLSRWH